LLSLHRAKGLEFPEVFLPAWENGVFPPAYGDINEERRLAYVGLTRGMRRVTISYCDFRRGRMTRSEFIRDIPPESSITGWQRVPQQAASNETSRPPNERLSA
jgi:DNA helicase-2/ATP-dependent DNA helicase PcrA